MKNYFSESWITSHVGSVASHLHPSRHWHTHPGEVGRSVHTTQEEPVLNFETALIFRKVGATKVHASF